MQILPTFAKTFKQVRSLSGASVRATDLALPLPAHPVEALDDSDSSLTDTISGHNLA